MEGGVASVIEQVRLRISDEGLPIKAAAREIGVTEDSLVRHLGGAYVRSDSLAKYRVWLNGDPSGPPQLDLLPQSHIPTTRDRPDLEGQSLAQIRAPRRKWRVVDLFSGAGGLSLGFELLRDRSVFQTVLAIDIEDAMVDTFNENHPSLHPVGRKVDLADFLNETEVRAFYLDHLRRVETDPNLDHTLAEGEPVSLDAFIDLIGHLDTEFLNSFLEFRSSVEFAAAYGALDSRVLGQTSVAGFHEALRLPSPATRDPGVEPMIWASDSNEHRQEQPIVSESVRSRWEDLAREVRRRLEIRWDAELTALQKRSEGSGRGQLASSARRIRRFLAFLQEVPTLRELWLKWRSRRDSLRFMMFGDPDVEMRLREAYTADRAVSVQCGGPPCQGFSRIGRGKIRSLRDDRVHVHYDSEAGDLRNRLFEKYVLFVAALSPGAFVFENVRHFQTEVQTPDGTFLATEILAEAVRELSTEGLNYRLASRTILASDHLIPQSRDRFFMAGVREDLVPAELPEAAEWILSLPSRPEVPLRFTLHDLPPPFHVGGPGAGANLGRTVTPLDIGDQTSGSAAEYTNWIRHSRLPGASESQGVDSHVARDHRRDDREWFALMGPGKRWMDYRCDESDTLDLITRAVQALRSFLETEGGSGRELPISSEELIELEGRLSGHLSIRLLLETIRPLPGELGHHLLKNTYLRKREGRHGDWLARLDATRPSKTVVTHMGKDTYAYVHPWEDRTLSVREAARIQSFPDSFSFGHLGLVDAFRVIGNAVPPLLSNQMAERVGQILTLREAAGEELPLAEAAAT